MLRELRIAAVFVAAGWISVPVHADEGVAACKLLSDPEIRQLAGPAVQDWQFQMKIWSNAKFEPMSGIGDEAHYYVQGGDYAGTYTRVGKHMLVVTRGLGVGEAPASARPLLETVTKAIVSKLE